MNPIEGKIVAIKLGYLTPDFRKMSRLTLMALSLDV